MACNSYVCKGIVSQVHFQAAELHDYILLQLIEDL